MLECNSFTEKSFSKEGETAATRFVDTGRRLMTADEVRCLSRNQAIFIHDNVRPMKLTLSPLHSNRGNKRKFGVAKGLEIIKKIREPEKKKGKRRRKQTRSRKC